MSEDKDENKLYIEGVVNPEKMGFLHFGTIGHQFGKFEEQIEACCKLLGRKKYFVDSDGYEIEVIAAAQRDDNVFAWIESRAKGTVGNVDISFTLYLFQDLKVVHSWEIKSYNPYFGCDVSYMRWWGDQVVTIYREKHHTYISSIGLTGDERCHAIEDEWLTVKDKVYYRGYHKSEVNIRQLPSLEELNSISVEQAKQFGVLPELLYNKP